MTKLHLLGYGILTGLVIILSAWCWSLTRINNLYLLTIFALVLLFIVFIAAGGGFVYGLL